MSFFEYFCEDCLRQHEEERSIGTEHPVSCPYCGAEYGETFHLNYQELTSVTFGKGVIPVTTMGQQSDINKRKLGKELLQQKEETYRKYDPECRTEDATKKILDNMGKIEL